MSQIVPDAVELREMTGPFSEIARRRLAIEQDLIANYSPPCNKQK